ncbi:hypothetical protein [Roseivirga sp.]|uniref:hypothetical protein n=1 Tax=Roseivirga sp. TaxID=1964215 RepID=UPI002B26B6BC|nr:hypothetical protein [Roseivirga sp.]
MSTAAAAQAAIQQAIKASGAIVKIEANDFSRMLSKMDDGLVIEHHGKLFFKDVYKYSTSYKGFVFYCKSNEKITIPSRLESISARQIWVPQ